MKRKIIILQSFIFVVASIYAQQQRQDVVPDFREKSGAELFFYRLGRIIDNALMKGLDTAYLGLPEKGWTVAFVNDYVGLNTTMNFQDINYFNSSTNIKFHSTPTIALGVAAGYRTLAFNYTWDVFSPRSGKFKFELLNKSWGIEFMRHVNDNIVGSIETLGRTPLQVNKKEIKFLTSYLSLYYVFGGERYSMTAHRRMAYVQKKSAGAFYLFGQYIGSKIETASDELVREVGDLKEIEMHQGAVGAGYGYNYTPNGGKFLLHVSAAPMLVFFNRSVLTFDMNLPIDDNTSVVLPIDYKVVPKVPFYVTGTARVAINWNINEWIYLMAYSTFHNFRFKEKERIEMKSNTWEWSANVMFGVRFGMDKKKSVKMLEDFDAHSNERKRDMIDWVEKLLNRP